MGLLGFLSNNTVGVDAAEAESKIRNEYPYLLYETEHIELAFKSKGEGGRDKSFFTSHRVLIKDGKGIGNKRRNYLSIPYKSIQAFAVQTAGGGASFLDRDTELKIWYDGGDPCGPKTIDFAKDQVNLFDIQQFFNKKVFQNVTTTKTTSTTATTTINNGNSREQQQQQQLQDYSTNKDYAKKATNLESVFNWIGNDAVKLDPKSVHDRFGFTSSRMKGEAEAEAESCCCPVLMPNEQVEVAYQARRDVIILTPTRFFLIDVKGLTGKKIEFFSLRWDCVKAFSVETAGGSFDRDSDFVVHTSIPSLKRLRQDLRCRTTSSNNKADIFQIQMYFSNKLLGRESSSSSSSSSNAAAAARIPGVDQRKGHVDTGADALFSASNNRPLDATEVERVYRSNPPLLQNDEFVEMAFRGRRDLVIFTTKRIIDVDVKGLTGKKIEYTSIPYSSILAFGVKTAGKTMDQDAEVMIYTDINCDSVGDEPDPGMSYKEWDFNKHIVDVLDLKRYLNARLLTTKPGMKVPSGLMLAAKKEHGLEKMMSKWGGDQRVIDADELNTFLHTDIDALLEGENVVMAFKAGRDISCFTNKRIFIMDVQGWSGKKIEYTSVPYSSVKAFSAKSAGSWDRDSKVNIYTKNHWSLSKLSLDFRKGKADIIVIQKFLSAIVLGNEQDVASYLRDINPNTVKINHPTGMNIFTDWIIDNSVEEDPDVFNAQLHKYPPILLSDESVEKVYREGRDLWVYTNLRILRVDVKGMPGSKVKYKSIPLNSVTAFEVETAGHLDRDAECFMYTNIPSIGRMMQKVLVRRGNIFDMHEYLGKKLLAEEQQHGSIEQQQNPKVIDQFCASSAPVALKSDGNNSCVPPNEHIPHASASYAPVALKADDNVYASAKEYDPYASASSVPVALKADDNVYISANAEYDPYASAALKVDDNVYVSAKEYDPYTRSSSISLALQANDNVRVSAKEYDSYASASSIPVALKADDNVHVSAKEYDSYTSASSVPVALKADDNVHVSAKEYDPYAKYK